MREISVWREGGSCPKRYLSGSKSRDRPPLRGYALTRTEKRLAKINGIHIEQGASVEYSCHRVGANIAGSRAQRGDREGGREGGQTNLVRKGKTRLNASVMRAKHVVRFLHTHTHTPLRGFAPYRVSDNLLLPASSFQSRISPLPPV